MTRFPTKDEERILLRLRWYLLGIASPEEQEETERLLFADDSFYEQVEIAEEELIDEYLHGELAPNERDQFERYFLQAPERQRRLRFAQSFNQYVATNRVKPSSWMSRIASRLSAPDNRYRAIRPMLVAAMLIITIGPALLAFKGLRWRRELHDLQAQLNARPMPASASEIQSRSEKKSDPGLRLAQNQRNALAEEVLRLAKAKDRGSRAPASVFPIPLLSGLLRGESSEKTEFKVPADAIVLRLLLDVGNKVDSRYEASLQSGSGLELLRWDSLIARSVTGGNDVTIEFPAILLPTGNYQVILRGLSGEGKTATTRSYSFGVVRM
jgi:hypothetical protein